MGVKYKDLNILMVSISKPKRCKTKYKKNPSLLNQELCQYVKNLVCLQGEYNFSEYIIPYSTFQRPVVFLLIHDTSF